MNKKKITEIKGLGMNIVMRDGQKIKKIDGWS